MFTFCVELLTGVEAVRREVGHVWQQSKLWQTCHLGDVDGLGHGGQDLMPYETTSKARFSSRGS